MQQERDLLSALDMLFSSHMHELRYNEPEYEREVLALMREIKVAMPDAEAQELQDLVDRHRAELEERGKAEFSNRLEDFRKAIAPFVS